MSDEKKVWVLESELLELIKQNKEMKADVIEVNQALKPVFGFIGTSRPIAALAKGAKWFMQNPDEFRKLGDRVSTFINKYSPETLAALNEKLNAENTATENDGSGK